jgi:predicted nuclease with TOPRIM domain
VFSNEGLESKIKDKAAALEKKDFELQTTEGLLAEAEAKIAKLNAELLSKLESFEQEKQKFNAKFETEVEKSSNLQKSLTELQNKCLEFSNRCVRRLKQIFNSVGANCEKFSPSTEDLPRAFEHIEGEVDDLYEIIAEHGDFCALVASWGTAVAFLKSGCTHEKLSIGPTLVYHQQIWLIFPILSEA